MHAGRSVTVEPVQTQTARRDPRALATQPIARRAAGAAFAPGARELIRPRAERRDLPLDATLARAVQSRRDGPVLARKKLTSPTPGGGMQNIITAVAAYNQVHRSGTATRRLELLRAVDQEIYAWYAALNATTISGPAAKEVGALARQSEDEYARIIASKGKKILPIDTTGMTQGEIDAATDLWESLATNAGRVSVQGSKEYVRRSRANLAKIMNTPTGRKLLTYLDQPGTAGSSDMSERVVIADVFAKGLQTDGLDLGQKSYAKGFGAGGAAAGTEQEIRKRTPGRKRKAANYRTITGPISLDNPAPTGLEEAIWAGQGGVKLGTDHYKFRSGATGAFVHTIRPDDLDQDIPNRAGNIAYTPEFITLAHELGHTMHHLAGATTGGVTAAGYYPSADTDWSNLEELFTIVGIDNPIRHESGLQVRASHATLASERAALKTKRKTKLLLRAQALLQKAIKPSKKAERDKRVEAYMYAVTDAVKGRATIVDDRVYADLKARLVKLETQYA